METREERIENERRERVASLAAAARKAAAADIRKRERLVRNLEADLEKHGDPERWKRYGDLLLANISNAKRDGDLVTVIDYFDEQAPEITIEAERQLTLNQAAEQYFRSYTKARNGREVILERLEKTRAAIGSARQKLVEIDEAEAAADEERLASFFTPKRTATETVRPKKKDAEIKGVRSFVSTDGFEILVGKAAKDNDYLTFRISRSLDTWMHAADYPGSHVVIRNPNRKEIPQRTLHEAASIAAFYSDARELEKAAVNYTERKFVNRIKGGPPGLVRLASFRTLLVKPGIVNNEKERAA